MAVQSLTSDKYEELCHEAEIAKAKYNELYNMKVETIWLKDLATLELALRQLDKMLKNNDFEQKISVTQE